jgi:hypothetical protein
MTRIAHRNARIEGQSSAVIGDRSKAVMVSVRA